jgi:uncharacterized protein (DUF58 family)
MTRILSREGAIWLGVAFVIGFCGWFKNINLMLLMAEVMAAMIVVNYWFARRQVRRVEAKRLTSPPAFAGETFRHAAEVCNPSISPVTVSVHSTAAKHQSNWFVPQLPPGESRKMIAEWRFEARGIYFTPPLVVRSGDPFGLIRYDRPVGDGHEFVILPRLGQVDLSGLRRWLIRTGAGDARTRRPVRRPGIHHADVRGVRPYRPGDQLRDIHWRTTARRDELTVREYDSTEPLDLIVVLDPWLPATSTNASKERFEWAVTMIASIAWAWAEADESAHVTLVIPGGDPPVRTIPSTRLAMRHALVPLARIRGSEESRPIPAGIFRRESNRCARLLVTSRPQSPMLGELRQSTGVPFVPLDPTMDPVWFLPPQPEARLAH